MAKKKKVTAPVKPASAKTPVKAKPGVDPKRVKVWVCVRGKAVSLFPQAAADILIAKGKGKIVDAPNDGKPYRIKAE